MKIKLLVVSFVATISMFVGLSSCSSDDNNTRIEASKIAESRSAQDLLNDLYLGCDGDVESLARILQATPSSIERVRTGKTEPTFVFEEKIKSVADYYLKNDRKFSIVQSALDPEYGWYDSVLNFPNHYPVTFWVLLIVFILIAFIPPCVILLILEGVVFLVAWIASLICAPDDVEDKYIDTINPVIEQVI